MDMRGNPLDEIEGVGPARKRALLHAFGSARGVARAAVEDLAKVEGVSEALAQRVHGAPQGVRERRARTPSRAAIWRLGEPAASAAEGPDEPDLVLPISKLCWFFLAPSHMVVWVALAAAVLLIAKRERLGRRNTRW